MSRYHSVRNVRYYGGGDRHDYIRPEHVGLQPQPRHNPRSNRPQNEPGTSQASYGHKGRSYNRTRSVSMSRSHGYSRSPSPKPRRHVRYTSAGNNEFEFRNTTWRNISVTTDPTNGMSYMVARTDKKMPAYSLTTKSWKEMVLVTFIMNFINGLITSVGMNTIVNTKDKDGKKVTDKVKIIVTTSITKVDSLPAEIEKARDGAAYGKMIVKKIFGHIDSDVLRYFTTDLQRAIKFIYSTIAEFSYGSKSYGTIDRNNFIDILKIFKTKTKTKNIELVTKLKELLEFRRVNKKQSKKSKSQPPSAIASADSDSDSSSDSDSPSGSKLRKPKNMTEAQEAKWARKARRESIKNQSPEFKAYVKEFVARKEFERQQIMKVPASEDVQVPNITPPDIVVTDTETTPTSFSKSSVTVVDGSVMKCSVPFKNKYGYVGSGAIVKTNLGNGEMNAVMTAHHVVHGKNPAESIFICYGTSNQTELKIKDMKQDYSHRRADVIFLTSDALDDLVLLQNLEPCPLTTADTSTGAPRAVCATYRWDSEYDRKDCKVKSCMLIHDVGSNVESPCWMGKSGSVVYQDGAAVGIVSCSGMKNGKEDFDYTGVNLLTQDSAGEYEWDTLNGGFTQVSFPRVRTFSILTFVLLALACTTAIDLDSCKYGSGAQPSDWFYTMWIADSKGLQRPKWIASMNLTMSLHGVWKNEPHTRNCSGSFETFCNDEAEEFSEMEFVYWNVQQKLENDTIVSHKNVLKHEYRKHGFTQGLSALHYADLANKVNVKDLVWYPHQCRVHEGVNFVQSASTRPLGTVGCSPTNTYSIDGRIVTHVPFSLLPGNSHHNEPIHTVPLGFSQNAFFDNKTHVLNVLGDNDYNTANAIGIGTDFVISFTTSGNLPVIIQPSTSCHDEKRGSPTDLTRTGSTKNLHCSSPPYKSTTAHDMLYHLTSVTSVSNGLARVNHHLSFPMTEKFYIHTSLGRSIGNHYSLSIDPESERSFYTFANGNVTFDSSSMNDIAVSCSDTPPVNIHHSDVTSLPYTHVFAHGMFMSTEYMCLGFGKSQLTTESCSPHLDVPSCSSQGFQILTTSDGVNGNCMVKASCPSLNSTHLDSPGYCLPNQYVDQIDFEGNFVEQQPIALRRGYESGDIATNVTFFRPDYSNLIKSVLNAIDFDEMQRLYDAKEVDGYFYKYREHKFQRYYKSGQERECAMYYVYMRRGKYVFCVRDADGRYELCLTIGGVDDDKNYYNINLATFLFSDTVAEIGNRTLFFRKYDDIPEKTTVRVDLATNITGLAKLHYQDSPNVDFEYRKIKYEINFDSMTVTSLSTRRMYIEYNKDGFECLHVAGNDNDYELQIFTICSETNNSRVRRVGNTLFVYIANEHYCQYNAKILTYVTAVEDEPSAINDPLCTTSNCALAEQNVSPIVSNFQPRFLYSSSYQIWDTNKQVATCKIHSNMNFVTTLSCSTINYCKPASKIFLRFYTGTVHTDYNIGVCSDRDKTCFDGVCLSTFGLNFTFARQEHMLRITVPMNVISEPKQSNRISFNKYTFGAGSIAGTIEKLAFVNGSVCNSSHTIDEVACAADLGHPKRVFPSDLHNFDGEFNSVSKHSAYAEFNRVEVDAFVNLPTYSIIREGDVVEISADGVFIKAFGKPVGGWGKLKVDLREICPDADEELCDVKFRFGPSDNIEHLKFFVTTCHADPSTLLYPVRALYCNHEPGFIKPFRLGTFSATALIVAVGVVTATAGSAFFLFRFLCRVTRFTSTDPHYYSQRQRRNIRPVMLVPKKSILQIALLCCFCFTSVSAESDSVQSDSDYSNMVTWYNFQIGVLLVLSVIMGLILFTLFLKSCSFCLSSTKGLYFTVASFATMPNVTHAFVLHDEECSIVTSLDCMIVTFGGIVVSLVALLILFYIVRDHRRKATLITLFSFIAICGADEISQPRLKSSKIENIAGNFFYDAEVQFTEPLKVGRRIIYDLFPKARDVKFEPLQISIEVLDVYCNYTSTFDYYSFDYDLQVDATYQCCGTYQCQDRINELPSSTVERLNKCPHEVHSYPDVFQRTAFHWPNCFCVTGNYACQYVSSCPIKLDSPLLYLYNLKQSKTSARLEVCLGTNCNEVTLTPPNSEYITVGDISIALLTLTDVNCEYNGRLVYYNGDLYDYTMPGYGSGKAGFPGDATARVLGFDENAVINANYVVEKPSESGMAVHSVGDTGYSTFVKLVKKGALNPISYITKGTTHINKLHNSTALKISQSDLFSSSSTMRIQVRNMLLRRVSPTYPEIEEYSLSALETSTDACYQCGQSTSVEMKLKATASGPIFYSCKPDICDDYRVDYILGREKYNISVHLQKRVTELCIELTQSNNTKCIRQRASPPRGYVNVNKAGAQNYTNFHAVPSGGGFDLSLDFSYFSIALIVIGVVGTIVAGVVAYFLIIRRSRQVNFSRAQMPFFSTISATFSYILSTIVTLSLIRPAIGAFLIILTLYIVFFPFVAPIVAFYYIRKIDYRAAWRIVKYYGPAKIVLTTLFFALMSTCYTLVEALY